VSYQKLFQNLQSGSRSRRIEVGKHSNPAKAGFRGLPASIQRGNRGPNSENWGLSEAKKLGLRGGFETASNKILKEKNHDIDLIKIKALVGR